LVIRLFSFFFFLILDNIEKQPLDISLLKEMNKDMSNLRVGTMGLFAMQLYTCKAIDPNLILIFYGSADE